MVYTHLREYVVPNRFMFFLNTSPADHDIVVFNQFNYSLLLGIKCVSKHQDWQISVVKLNTYE